MYNRWIRFLGIFGSVLLAFGLIGTWRIGGFEDITLLLGSPILVIHLGLGLISIVFWLIATKAAVFTHPRELLWGRQARYGYNATTSTVVIIGLLAFANFYAGTFNKRWDLTAEGVYSLQPQSISAIKNLKKPLKLVSLKGVPTANELEQKRLLDLYQYYNPTQVKLESFNPRAKPNLVKEYDFKAGNLVALVYGEGKEANTSRLNEVSEEAITNGILKLTRGDSKKIYFLNGHEELNTKEMRDPAGASRFRDGLADQNFKVEDLLLSTVEKVPDDAAALIVLSPKRQMRPEEKDRLIKYIERGGHVLLTTDPRSGNPDLKELAGHFKIEIGENVVLDKYQTIFGSGVGAEPIAKDYSGSGATKDFSAAQPTVFNLAATVKKAADAPSDATYTDLVKSSSSAWAETNLSALLDSEEPIAAKEDSDLAGPVTLAISYEKKVKPEGSSTEISSRLIVVGDSDWLNNSYLSALGFFNRELALGIVNWASGEESAVTIRKGQIKPSQMPLTKDMAMAILVTILIVPELILLFGLMVWWKRRTAYA